MYTFLRVSALLFVTSAANWVQAAEPIKLTDEVGPLTVGAPSVGDKPKTTQSVFAPGITKEFRFVGDDGSAAVLVSTKIRPDLPKDDRIIERIKPRYEGTRDGFDEGQAELKIVGEAPNRVMEFVLLNSDYNDFYPQVLGQRAGKEELETIGVTQIFVTNGRMVECALHLPNPEETAKERVARPGPEALHAMA